MAAWIIFTILSFLCVTRAEDGAAGLENVQGRAVLPPEAQALFHPDQQSQSKNNTCDPSDCMSLPVAASVQSTPVHESASTGGRELGAGGVAGIPIGFIFACLIAAGVCFVAILRQTNSQRPRPQQQQQEEA